MAAPLLYNRESLIVFSIILSVINCTIMPDYNTNKKHFFNKEP